MPPVDVILAPYPGLRVSVFETAFPDPLGEARADAFAALLTLDAEGPLARSEETRKGVRDLLRHDGYKPTGRGKPSAEYLVRAAGSGALNPINLAVDACNAVSLASGLPISVVDLERARAPFSIRSAEAGTAYVFNASGQEIDVSGLLCLFDADGPCANPVKDAQRTKTSAVTMRTLSIVWASDALRDELGRATEWYHALLRGVGAEVTPVATRAG